MDVVEVCQFFLNDSIKSVLNPDISYNSNSIEIVSISVKLNESELYILGCYRPHSGTIEEFITDFSHVLNNQKLQNKRTILLGDLNINLLIDNPEREQFMNFMRSYYFVPRITKPTRFSSNENETPSLLDQIWTNFVDNVITGILSIDITDHCPIFLYLPIDNNKHSNDKIKITFRDQSPERTSAFMSAIADLDWSNIIASDPSTYVDNFLTTINGLYCNFFPLRTKFITKKRMSKPWITSNILSLIKQKSDAFQLYRRGLITMRENNLLKNKITSAIRSSKRPYYKFKFIKFKNDMQKTWSNIKSVHQSSQNSNIIKAILFYNVEVTDEFGI